jgi:hypothetical protein
LTINKISGGRKSLPAQAVGERTRSPCLASEADGNPINITGAHFGRWDLAAKHAVRHFAGHGRAVAVFPLQCDWQTVVISAMSISIGACSFDRFATSL